MKKIEIVWRELLYQALEKNNYTFNQSKLAREFGFSTSTIFAALKELRALGIVRVEKKFFQLNDWEKLLLFWATKRQLSRDIVYKTKADLPTITLEGSLPASVIPTGYTAYRFRFATAPSEYDCVYVYGEKAIVEKRFSFNKGTPNLFVLKSDPFLPKYQKFPLGQLFADLWNLPQWYARDFYQSLLDKIKK